MDRSAFLSGLPFLIPLHTPEWPPVTDGTILLGESYDSRTFVLSLELPNVTVRTEGPSAGNTNDETDSTDNSKSELHMPLFFSKSNRSKIFETGAESDPALATVQIALVEHSEESHSFVFLRVDDQVFALDLPQCNGMEVHPAAYNTDNNEEEDVASYRRRRISRPCSLAMQFDDVTLRIFRNNLDICMQDKDSLTEVCSRLGSLEHVMFRGPDGTPPSPSRSSSNGNNSSGSTTIDGMAGLHHPTSDSGHKRPADCESHPLTTFQRHHDAYHDTYSHLDKIQRVLTMPISAISSIPNVQVDDNGDSLKTSLKSLLSATAPLMSETYVSDSTLTRLDEYYSTLHKQCEEQMQELLCAAFPVTQRSGRRRRSIDGVDEAVPKIPERQSLVTVEFGTKAFLDLIAEQKRIVEEQHQLYLLPTRG